VATIDIGPLEDGLPFGARIRGVTRGVLADDAVRRRIRDTFEQRGLIVFEDVEPSDEMLVAISQLIGPLQDLALENVSRVDEAAMPGVVTFNNEPADANVFEIDGKLVSGWLSWHFDACYTRVLNRGAVLRVVDNPPEGGLTGFADGIQLYNGISPEQRARFQDLRILYHPRLMFQNQRFAMPKQFRMVRLQAELLRLFAEVEKAPRAVHPAIWKRPSGEHVLHVCPYQADGIAGHEGPEGDALLESLFQEIYARMTPYWHEWKGTDMLVWDNWRFIHSASGHDPKYSRRVHRTTIDGDYGLGAFEAT
jgi:taurine dioxygenase